MGMERDKYRFWTVIGFGTDVMVYAKILNSYEILSVQRKKLGTKSMCKNEINNILHLRILKRKIRTWIGKVCWIKLWILNVSKQPYVLLGYFLII